MTRKKYLALLGLCLCLVTAGCLSSTFFQEDFYTCPDIAAEGSASNYASLSENGSYQFLSGQTTLSFSDSLSLTSSDSYLVEEIDRGHLQDTGNSTRAEYDIDLDEKDGELAVDHNRIYADVVEMVGVEDSEVDPPSVVVVSDGTYSGTARGRTVKVSPDLSDEKTRVVLAHEFFHVIQSQYSPIQDLRSKVGDESLNFDQRLVVRSVIEGSARYIESEYAKKSSKTKPDNSLDLGYVPCKSPYAQHFYSAYHHGHAYFNQSIESPEAVWDVYSNPPRTTEQILHGGSEEPTELEAVVEDSSRWSFEGESSSRVGVEGETLGELGLRITLRTRLNVSHSVEAADGWGNDRIVEFNDASENAFAWVIEMDTSGDADELEEAFSRYRELETEYEDKGYSDTLEEPFVETLWGNNTGEISVDTTDPKTVVVFMGPESFVANAVAERVDEESVKIDVSR